MLEPVRRGLSVFWDWLITTDPGLIRLRTATWAVLTAAISFEILSYAGNLLGQASPINLLGVIVGVSAIAVNDPELPGQRITTVLMPVPALIAVLLAVLLPATPLIRELALLAVIFAAVRLRQYGARGTLFGLVIFMTYLFSINMGLVVSRLPWVITAIITGSLVAFLVRFVFLPIHPVVIFNQSLHAFQANAIALLAELADLVQDPQRLDHHRKALRRQLYKIGDLAIDLESLLGPPPDAAAPEDPVENWRTALLEVELSLEALVDGAVQLLQGELISSEKLAGFATLFHALQASLQSNHTRQPLPLDLFKNNGAEKGNSALSLALHRMEWAAHNLNRRAVWPVPGEIEARLEATNIVSPHPSTSQTDAENLRVAVQATLAVGLAILAGVLISATRWYWAVIAAFVLFVRASTLEEALSRAWQRVAGTLIGVVVGIFLAEVIIDDHRLEVAILLAGFFIAYFLITLTYTGFVFVLTVVLAILYKLVGAFQPGLLVLRLEETLVGAAAGILVASFVFPRYRSAKNRQNVAKFMQKVGQLLEPVLPGLENAEQFEALRHTAGEIDEELKTLRGALSSLGGRFLAHTSPATRERIHKLSLLSIAIRHYLLASSLSQPDTQFQQQTSAIERHLAVNAMTIAKALEDQTSPLIHPPESLLLQGMQASPPLADATAQQTAMQWLARIDRLQGEIAADPQV
jgi:uncharacterized membrane protein YgaE (UPF0421/DUF939 family)